MKNLQEKRNCLTCGKERMVKQSVLRKGHGKFCSVSCKSNYFWGMEDYITKQSLAHKGFVPSNIVSLIEMVRLTNSYREKKIGKPAWNKGLRTKEPSDRKCDAFYKEWRNDVYKRDSYKCRISNDDCKGRIEAHHILPWRTHGELRYTVTNGITLCSYHHPRKHSEEKRLEPMFIELINYHD